MSKINRNNYEVFLIDYMDDNLSDSDKNMVLDFLSKNPDIKEEFESIQDFELPQLNASFNQKEDLFKSEKNKKINMSNYEDFFIAFVNNELDSETKKELAAFIKANPELEDDFELFKKTKVKADTSIKFDEKAAFFAIDEETQIDENNFDSFAIASLENDLSSKKQSELNEFVENNDSFKKELDLYSKTKVKADKSIVFDDKNKLKEIAIIAVGDFNKSNYQNAIISSLEGDLSDSEEKEFQEFLDRNPFVKEEYKAYSLTYLKADKSIVFDDKESLKAIAQPQIKRKPLYLNSYFSVAASVAAIFVFAFIFNNRISSIYLPEGNNIALNKNTNKVDNEQFTSRPDISYAFIGDDNNESKTTNSSPDKVISDDNNENKKSSNIKRGSININKVSSKDMRLVANADIKHSFDLKKFQEDITYATTEPKIIYADNSRADKIMEKPLMKRATEAMNNLVNKNQGVKDVAKGNVDSKKVLSWAVKGINSVTEREIKFADKK